MVNGIEAFVISLLQSILFFFYVEFVGGKQAMAVFILEDALCIWMNLGKHSLFVSSVKTGTRCIIYLDELSMNVCPSLSRHIMHPLI